MATQTLTRASTATTTATTATAAAAPSGGPGCGRPCRPRGLRCGRGHGTDRLPAGDGQRPGCPHRRHRCRLLRRLPQSRAADPRPGLDGSVGSRRRRGRPGGGGAGHPQRGAVRQLRVLRSARPGLAGRARCDPAGVGDDVLPRAVGRPPNNLPARRAGAGRGGRAGGLGCLPRPADGCGGLLAVGRARPGLRRDSPGQLRRLAADRGGDDDVAGSWWCRRTGPSATTRSPSPCTCGPTSARCSPTPCSSAGPRWRWPGVWRWAYRRSCSSGPCRAAPAERGGRERGRPGSNCRPGRGMDSGRSQPALRDQHKAAAHPPARTDGRRAGQRPAAGAQRSGSRRRLATGADAIRSRPRP